MSEDVREVTAALRRVAQERTGADNELLNLVYEDLRRIARHVRSGSGSETLATTGLVHEAYLRLLAEKAPRFNDRTHFFSVAAQAMRNVAVDYARRQMAQKRGGTEQRVSLDLALEEADRGQPESLILGIHESLEALEKQSQRLARHVMLSFFVGLTQDEIAELEGTTPRTVRRDWRKARAWLFAHFNDANGEHPGDTR